MSPQRAASLSFLSFPHFKTSHLKIFTYSSKCYPPRRYLFLVFPGNTQAATCAPSSVSDMCPQMGLARAGPQGKPAPCVCLAPSVCLVGCPAWKEETLSHCCRR